MYFQKLSRSEYLYNPEKLGEFTDFVQCRIKECMRSYKSKEETLKFIHDTFQSPRQFTRLVWNRLEKQDLNYFSSYKILCKNIRNASSEAVTAVAQTTPSNVVIETLTETALNDASSVEAATTSTSNMVKNVSSKTKRRSNACKKVKQEKQQQQQAPEQAHKLQSNGDGKPCTDTKELKRQSSWEQVRGGYEQAEILQDLNQQVQQKMQRMDIPGNEGSDNSSEDALYD